MLCLLPGMRVRFYYTNYRGKRSLRDVTIKGVDYGDNDYYSERQWFLRCFDHEKQDHRSFALKLIEVEKLEILSKELCQDLSEAPRVADYRFGTMIKSERFAYARGLTINPTHLPDALDAMAKDDWHLVAIFGQTESHNIGFIFERRGPDKRVQELLEANTQLVLENRELKNKYNEIKFRMDGLEK